MDLALGYARQDLGLGINIAFSQSQAIGLLLVLKKNGSVMASNPSNDELLTEHFRYTPLVQSLYCIAPSILTRSTVPNRRHNKRR